MFTFVLQHLNITYVGVVHFFYKQPVFKQLALGWQIATVFKQLALGWQIAKQLSGLNPLPLSNNKSY